MKSENITTVAEASEVLGWNKQAIRVAAQQGKLTFATAVKHERSVNGEWTYYIDKKALYKCANGEKELFRA